MHRLILPAALASLAAANAVADVQIFFADRFLECGAEVLRSDFEILDDYNDALNFGPGPWDESIDARVNTGPSFVRAAADQDSSITTQEIRASASVSSNINVNAPDRDGVAYADSLFGVYFEVSEPIAYRLVGSSEISSFDSLTCFYMESDNGFELEYLDDTGAVDVEGVLQPGGYDLFIDACLFAAGGGMDSASFDWTLTLTPIPTDCDGDVNGDQMVDFGDLNALLDAWGDAVAAGDPLDLDGSGAADFGDLNILLENWGLDCTPAD